MRDNRLTKEQTVALAEKLSALEAKGAKFRYDAGYVDSFFSFHPDSSNPQCDEDDMSTWTISSEVWSDKPLSSLHPGCIRVYLPCGALDEIEDVNSIPEAPAAFDDND